ELKKIAEVTPYEIVVVDEAEVMELQELSKLAVKVSPEKLTNSIIFNAIEEKASDIHLESYKDYRYRIRYRIDGLLNEILLVPEPIALKIISRVKVMANLDISKKNIPQDGRAKIKFKNRLINLRISSLPGLEGEKIVVRILDRDNVIVPIERLGLRGEPLKIFMQYIYKPQGFILVTGPTGCGKTTTLYSALYKIGSLEKSIVTIEDPVEYQIERFNQVQIDTKKGLTFASILRSVLRQDPNIILVGEIRDKETAEISIHAALTGHLVLSTLHTNNTFDAIIRLIDMGIEPFLVSASLSCVIAQRLVRLLCPHCKKPYKPNPELIERLKISPNDYTFYNPEGCPKCRHNGYKGRIGIFEILPVTSDVKRFIQEKKDSTEIKNEMKKRGMKTLWEDGVDKVIDGVTSVEELLKVLPEEEFL
ncbi:MAG: GspE/PulE family protein, partial [Elusimicrobiota bacterium]|nr:GspE/PulE family protein [Elusimicrobiota bacterium]